MCEWEQGSCVSLIHLSAETLIGKLVPEILLVQPPNCTTVVARSVYSR